MAKRDDKEKKGEEKSEVKSEAKASEKTEKLPEIEPPPPKGEPWPDATPEPMRPVEPATSRAPTKPDFVVEALPSEAKTEPVAIPDSLRTRTETVTMPLHRGFGVPPEMPTSTAPPPLVLGAVENPTHMPGPRDVPGGGPDDPAPPPGRVPPGDSRSMRSGTSFALVYRVGTYVISRFGTVGTRGQWRVVEYPTSASASHAYAKECSRFVSEGFSDYRD